jgi:hypothetical protein
VGWQPVILNKPPFLPRVEGSGTGRVVAPDPYHSRAGDQLGAYFPLVKLLTSTVHKVIATAVPIASHDICMI